MKRYVYLVVVLLALALPRASSGNGWNPKFTSDGTRIVSGAGVLTVTDAVTNVSHDVMLNGWEPDPCDTETVIYNGSQNGLRLLNLRTGADEQLDPRELIELACARTPQRLFWAARDVAANAIVSNAGHVIPNAGQPTIADNGFFGFRTGDDHIEPFACDQGLVWHDLRGTVSGFVLDNQTVRNFTVPGRQEYRPVCIATPAGMWLLTMTPTGLLLHQAGGTEGYELETGDNRNLNAHAVLVGDEVRVAFNNSRGTLLRWNQSLRAPRKSLIVTGPRPPPIDPPPPPPPQRLTVPDRRQETTSFLSPRLTQLDSLDATRAHSFEQLNALCQALARTDRRWGLLEKTSGARVKDRASDVLVYQVSDTEAQVVDVIADAEGVKGTPRPTWIVKDIRPIRQWKAPFPLTDAPPPPPPPPNCDACQAENVRLQAELHALRSLLTEVEIARDRATAERDAAITERDELRRQLDDARQPVTCQLVGQQRIFGIRIGGRCEAAR